MKEVSYEIPLACDTPNDEDVIVTKYFSTVVRYFATEQYVLMTALSALYEYC
jgi:hypothetical protein